MRRWKDQQQQPTEMATKIKGYTTFIQMLLTFVIFYEFVDPIQTCSDDTAPKLYAEEKST